jgi:opacity protein-like surface antigen
VHKILIGSAAALVLITNAHAAQVTGTIQSVNVKSDSVTLSDGRVYMLPEGIEAESVRVGDKVEITFTAIKGGNRASALVKSK